MFFDQFKMRLHSENLSLSSVVQSTSGKPALVLDVLAHALRYFKQLALADVSDQVGRVVEPQDLQWVVTVPAIWRQDAKQIMREASYKAGLASPVHPNQLLIALEPEAAALYCRHLESHEVVSFPDDASANSGSSGGGSGSGNSAQMSMHYGGGGSVRHAKGEGAERLRAVQLAPGDGYLVVDCGGGTVDITAHQLASDGRTLKEIFQASGGPYGSSSVDRAFEALLSDLFSIEFMTSFKQKYPASYVDLLVAFEAKKRCVSPYKLNALNISLPFSFVEHFKKIKGQKVEQAVKKFGGRHVSWTSQGMLRLSSELMHSLFEPTLVGIKRSISDVLSAVEFFQELHYLFLVGGFAESALVQNFVRKMVAGKLKVIIPQDVSLAVMKGAVLFGINPQSVAVRRARLTYGVGVLHRWDADRHPLEKRICKSGTDWCTDVFDPFVLVGQSLSCGDRVSRLYCPATPNQREIVIQIYCTAAMNPHFVTDPGVVKCGVLRLALDPHGNHVIKNGVKVLPGQDPKTPARRREIEASMSFGETELKISAIDKETGTCVDCCIDFLKEDKK